MLFATGTTVGLAEWIINDTYVLYLLFFFTVTITQSSVMTCHHLGGLRVHM